MSNIKPKKYQTPICCKARTITLDLWENAEIIAEWEPEHGYRSVEDVATDSAIELREQFNEKLLLICFTPQLIGFPTVIWVPESYTRQPF